MYKEKILKGNKVKYKGKEIENITSMFYDAYDGKIRLSYKEDENTYINVTCEPKDVEMTKE